ARVAEPQTMFGSVKRRGPRMGPVIFVKRQQLVDRAPFIVGVINLCVTGIKNSWRSGAWIPRPTRPPLQFRRSIDTSPNSSIETPARHNESLSEVRASP